MDLKTQIRQLAKDLASEDDAKKLPAYVKMQGLLEVMEEEDPEKADRIRETIGMEKKPSLGKRFTNVVTKQGVEAYNISKETWSHAKQHPTEMAISAMIGVLLGSLAAELI